MLPSALRRATIVAALAGIGVTPALTSGCSSGPAGGSCPTTYPMTCPDPAPHFAADVAPLIHGRCTTCHAQGQQIPTLESYASFAATSTQQHVFFQVQSCLMPPPPRSPLTTAERDTILGWLVCGAMND